MHPKNSPSNVTALELHQVQQRYRSIEAIFRESFEHMENEASVERGALQERAMGWLG